MTKRRVHLSTSPRDARLSFGGRVEKKLNRTRPRILATVSNMQHLMSVRRERGMQLLVGLVVVYFGWADIALYLRVQRTPITAIQTLSQSGTTTSQPQTTEYVPSIFKGFSIKLIMMDHVNNYIINPMAEWVNEALALSVTQPWLTPNWVSFAGVVSAAIAGYCVSRSSFSSRRIGVLFFQIRIFFDAIDGMVARDRLHITQHVSLTNTTGYLVDGLADTVGTIFLLVGIYIYLKRNPPKVLSYLRYLPLSHGDEKNGSSETKSVLRIIHSPAEMKGLLRTPFFLVGICGLQMVISSAFWNLYISGYHDLLEVNTSNAQLPLQSSVFHATSSWLVFWTWRLANPCSLAQILLIALFFNRVHDYLVSVQWIGLVGVAFVVSATQAHYHFAKLYIVNGSV